VHAAGRGTARTGRGRVRRQAHAAGWGGADGRRARPGGVRTRQAGQPACAARAGPGQGRHEATEGLGWLGVSEGRQGEMVLACVAWWGTAEAGRAGGRRMLRLRQGGVGSG
jgi:hypothetical protein